MPLLVVLQVVITVQAFQTHPHTPHWVESRNTQVVSIFAPTWCFYLPPMRPPTYRPSVFEYSHLSRTTRLYLLNLPRIRDIWIKEGQPVRRPQARERGLLLLGPVSTISQVVGRIVRSVSSPFNSPRLFTTVYRSMEKQEIGYPRMV